MHKILKVWDKCFEFHLETKRCLWISEINKCTLIIRKSLLSIQNTSVNDINYFTKSFLYLPLLTAVPGPHLLISPADLMSYFTLRSSFFFSLPLSSHCKYNSILLWYFRKRSSGRELRIWQSDLIENTVNPTLAPPFNLTSSLTHCCPINPVLNPKAFSFCGQCATHHHKFPSDSVSLCPPSQPPHPCLCVFLSEGLCREMSLRVQAQLASSSWKLFPLGIFVNALVWAEYLDKQTSKTVQPARASAAHMGH